MFSPRLYQRLKFFNLRFYSAKSVRVRFAPSPTGHLHFGGLRTALFNYLFAKSNNGKFVLRIEDTDQFRSKRVKGAAEQLYDDLTWAGIEFDESPYDGGQYGPYTQSKRLQIYSDQVKRLLQTGSAYHCFCPKERLDLLREAARKVGGVRKYDNNCRNLSKEKVDGQLMEGAAYCVRFKLQPGLLGFQDLIYGKRAYDAARFEGDPIIMKSDGFPTYHFANVVDDHFMEISHVLRGDEWLISTTKHLLLYKAFNWEPPLYGHLPLLMNSDGTKLSKRQDDDKESIFSRYRKNGIFPLSVINFIVHSGGGFTKDLQQNVKPSCYTLDELKDQFRLDLIKSHPGHLMPERLMEFNRLELKRRLGNKSDEANLIAEAKELLSSHFRDKSPELRLQLSDEHIRFVLHWSIDRIEKLSDLVSHDLRFLWTVPEEMGVDEGDLGVVEKLGRDLVQVEEFRKELLKVFLKEFADRNGVKFSGFMKLLRSVLSGLKDGPGVAEMMEMLGKENTVNRIEMCLNKNKIR